ncbi:MAG TPA: trehalose-6-phosphate synthase [Acidimicrobiia bacterium]|nr:trehalose-6-phosphate synthase [Acidimicrobiia bacterium]
MLVASHRGPSSFTQAEDGSFTHRRGAGGVVSALEPLLTGPGAAGHDPATWVAAAMSDDDRAAVRAGAATAPHLDLHLLALDPHVHRLHYDVVSNSVLWFLHHGLFDLPRRPRFDARFHEAWDAYTSVNRTFAEHIAECAPPDEVVLVQDYHLALAPGALRRARPDLRVTHFNHTPFCGPTSIRVLPDIVADAICESMASVPSGFHTARWARAYEACAHEILGANRPVTPAFVASLGPDADDLAATAASPEAAAAARTLDEQVGERALIVRTDRIEPSKNIVRGFLAFDLLLAEHPEWRERVVFVALVYASREGLPEYLAYRQEVEQAAARVNERWGRGDWQPVVLDTRDDHARSVAGLLRYDALLVNPIRDGLNLVAKEGPLVNRRDGVVCLSREAGAFDELRDGVLAVHPYDLVQTAAALHTALTMPEDERRDRAARLRTLAAARTPQDWLDDQVRAALA